MAATEPTKMRRWSRWMTAWTALSVPGLCVAVTDWGLGATAAMASVVSVLVGFFVVVLTHDQEQRQTPPTGAGWASRVVLSAVSLFISTAAIVATVPGLALLVVLVVIATTPPMVDLGRRVLGQVDSAPVPPLPVDPTTTTTTREPPPPRQLIETARTMTDRQLCQAWRNSYWALKDARHPTEKLRLVEQRTRFLDELEARNAAALEAWLASGARACDGPDKFFTNDGRGQSAAA